MTMTAAFHSLTAPLIVMVLVMMACIAAVQLAADVKSGRAGGRLRRGTKRTISFARFAGQAGNIPTGNPSDILTIKREDLEAIVRSQVSEGLATKLLDQKKAADELAREANAKEAVEAARGGKSSGHISIHGKDSDPFKGKGINFAKFVKTIALAKMDGERPLTIAKNRKDDVMIAAFEKANAMSEGVMADGGALVPDEFSSEFIDLLRARAVVRGLGARPLPMNRGTLSISKQTGAATANYVGENAVIPASKPAVGALQLSAKKLAAIVAISNDLIRDAVYSADAFVRDDSVKVVALREDLAFLRGDGTQFTPKGIRNWTVAANVFAATQTGASATAAEVIADSTKQIRLVEESNVGMVSCGWAMTPRSKWYLMNLRDGVGGFIFKDEMSRGTFWGYPFKTTTQIPQNLGGGTNESEIYFGDFSEAIIGENTTLLVEAFPNGTYIDPTSGVAVSGISSDQTVVRVIERHDFGLRHENTFSVLSTVKYGV